MTEDTHEELCAVPEGKEREAALLKGHGQQPMDFDLDNDTKANVNANEFLLLNRVTK